MQIRATAPVRICDIGGWTDTWFGGPGRVFNIAVTPGAEVVAEAAPGRGHVVVEVRDEGHRYRVVPGERRRGRHLLVEAAIDAWPPPGDRAVSISVSCGVPSGSGTGTSATVAVALLSVLARLRGERPSHRELARRALRLEVELLGRESGVQDQLAAAFGGVSFIEVDRFPDAVVRRLPPWDGVEDRLSLVLLGSPHDSSAIHRQVVAQLSEHRGDELDRLRRAADAARRAFVAHDLPALGAAMVANTDAQRRLHPDLVGREATHAIEVARGAGAVGWKVNGAGGAGGSLTLLGPSTATQGPLRNAVAALGHRVLPVCISTEGAVVIES